MCYVPTEGHNSGTLWHLDQIESQSIDEGGLLYLVENDKMGGSIMATLSSKYEAKSIQSNFWPKIYFKRAIFSYNYGRTIKIAFRQYKYVGPKK